MALDPKTEHYIVLSLWEKLQEIDDVPRFSHGMRHRTEGLIEWINFVPPKFIPHRRRRSVYYRSLLFHVQCHSLIAEFRPDKDANAPWRTGSRVRQLFEHVDLDVQTVGDAPRTSVGTLNIHEVDLTYVDETNIIFQGQGDFAIDQHQVHTVVARIAATFIQEVVT